jgi:hypothetical protein
VFFYIDPAIMQDASLERLRSVTLSYTFFRSKADDQEDEADAGGAAAALPAAEGGGGGGDAQRVAAWTAEVAGKLGVALPGGLPPQPPASAPPATGGAK